LVHTCLMDLIILRHSIVYALSMIWERFVVYVENYLGTFRCLCRKLFGNVLLSMYSQWFGDLSLSMCRQWFGRIIKYKLHNGTLQISTVEDQFNSIVLVEHPICFNAPMIWGPFIVYVQTMIRRTFVVYIVNDIETFNCQ
jgi:hypothetical protein